MKIRHSFFKLGSLFFCFALLRLGFFGHMSAQLGAILYNLNKFQKIKTRIVLNQSLKLLNVSGAVSRSGFVCEETRVCCSTIACPWRVPSVSWCSVACNRLWLTRQICKWVFIFVFFFCSCSNIWRGWLQPLMECTFCVLRYLSVFLSLINGPVSNPPLIFCDTTSRQLAGRWLAFYCGCFLPVYYLQTGGRWG